MEMAVGRLYVQKYFLEEAKSDVSLILLKKNTRHKATFNDIYCENIFTKVVHMINSLSEEFKKILNESDWMDADSKRIALEKVAKTLKFVFFGSILLFLHTNKGKIHGLKNRLRRSNL